VFSAVTQLLGGRHSHSVLIAVVYTVLNMLSTGIEKLCAQTLCDMPSIGVTWWNKKSRGETNEFPCLASMLSVLWCCWQVTGRAHDLQSSTALFKGLLFANLEQLQEYNASEDKLGACVFSMLQLLMYFFTVKQVSVW